MEKIKIGIIGLGNVGKSVFKVLPNNPDMELVGIFTRRISKDLIIPEMPVYSINKVKDFTNKIDIMILCGGSVDDLPKQAPNFAKQFNVIDGYDTHAKIPEYFATMDLASKEGNKLSIISTGWDPGLFSLNRLYGETFLPISNTYSFWGFGVSQGHSQAVRSITGVKKAVQYTVPSEELLEKIRSGDTPELTVREKHIRVCYVVIDDNATKYDIEREIKMMPDYFADYDTTVNFISEEEFNSKHREMPHGGIVITSGCTTKGAKQIIEFSLKLESNPEFTAGIMIAYARAAYKLYKKGEIGAKTVFDIAPSLLSPKNPEQLIKEIL